MLVPKASTVTFLEIPPWWVGNDCPRSGSLSPDGPGHEIAFDARLERWLCAALIFGAIIGASGIFLAHFLVHSGWLEHHVYIT